MANLSFPHPVYGRTVLQPAYADAQHYLFAPMLAAHEAHALMLAGCDIIPAAQARAILQAVAQIRQAGPDAYRYMPGVEDLFFRVEAAIIEQAGADAGGNLQLARSRNDLGQALARMALRQEVLQVAHDLLSLRTIVLGLAKQHLATVMPGYTHTQPAQPVTFAHYLAGVLAFLAADQARLQRAYANVNQSPLGAAAFTGTGFAVDRAQVASYLGFDDVIASTQHSIGAGDHLTDVAFAVQSLAVGLSRTTKDLLFLATQESGALHIHDSFIQISSIMPQKRNPVVLEHLRARLSRTIGAAQTIVIQCHNIPYGDTQDIEDEILPPVLLALHTLRDCLDLYSAVFATLELNRIHLAQQAGAGFTTATELADTLVRVEGLPFRNAHKVVATLVQAAVQDGKSADTLGMNDLQAAAQQVVGRSLAVMTEEQLRAALDPQAFVAARAGLGGTAPQATLALLDHAAAQLEQDRLWHQGALTNLEVAEQTRAAAIGKFLMG